MQMMSHTIKHSKETNNFFPFFEYIFWALYLKPFHFLEHQNTMPSFGRNPLSNAKSVKQFFRAAYGLAQKKPCQSGTFSCPKCPHLSTKKNKDLIYHLAKHCDLKYTLFRTVCTLYLEEFPGGENVERQLKFDPFCVKRWRKNYNWRNGTRITNSYRRNLVLVNTISVDTYKYNIKILTRTTTFFGKFNLFCYEGDWLSLQEKLNEVDFV